MHWFWVIPLFFGIIMFALFALVLRHGGDWRHGPLHGLGWGPWGGSGAGRGPWAQPPAAETAREILDRRYAAGELTKEQYDQMRRDIDPGRAAA